MKNSDNHKINTGERLKALRTSLGLTLAAFSAPLSIGLGTVNNYEKGKASPSEAVLRQIESIYRMNRNWYETGEGDMLLPVYPDGASEERPVVCEGQPQLRDDQKRILQLWDKLDCDGKAAVLLVCKAITKQ